MEVLPAVPSSTPAQTRTPKKRSRKSKEKSKNSKDGEMEHQKCCHYCAHSKAEHVIQHLCTSCKRMYCDNCLQVNLALATSEFVEVKKPFVCPKCSGICCCLKVNCEQKHTHCRPYTRSPRGQHSSYAGGSLSLKAETARDKLAVDCNEVVLHSDSGAGAALRSTRPRRRRGSRSGSSEEDPEVRPPPAKRRKIESAAKFSSEVVYVETHRASEEEEEAKIEEDTPEVPAYLSDEPWSPDNELSLAAKEAATGLMNFAEVASQAERIPNDTVVGSSIATAHPAAEDQAGSARSEPTCSNPTRQGPTRTGANIRESLPFGATANTAGAIANIFSSADMNALAQMCYADQQKLLHVVRVEIKHQLGLLRQEMHDREAELRKAMRALELMLASIRDELQKGPLDATANAPFGITPSQEEKPNRLGQKGADGERLPPITS